MDAFALLCNLHASGPATLRRLRRVGIHSLDQIARVSETDLAEHLNGPPSLARRFKIEAETLAQRVVAMPLEAEQPDEVTAPFERAPLQTVTPTPKPPQPPRPWPEMRSPLPARRQEREAPERMTPPHTATLLSSEALGHPNLATADSLLRPGLIEGLDKALCERFVAQGVRTLETLIAMTELNFARTVGIPYTKLLDFQFAAQRILGPVLKPVAPPVRRTVPLARTPRLGAYHERLTRPEQPHTKHTLATEVSGPFV